MLHHTCDLCGQRIDDGRFIIRLEVFPAFDPEEITEADLDQDNLEGTSIARKPMGKHLNYLLLHLCYLLLHPKQLDLAQLFLTD